MNRKIIEIICKEIVDVNDELVKEYLESNQELIDWDVINYEKLMFNAVVVVIKITYEQN